MALQRANARQRRHLPRLAQSLAGWHTACKGGCSTEMLARTTDAGRSARMRGPGKGWGRTIPVVVGVVALMLTTLLELGGCAGPGAPIGPSIPREGGGSLGGGTPGGMLAFLVQPNNVAAGSP